MPIAHACRGLSIINTRTAVKRSILLILVIKSYVHFVNAPTDEAALIASRASANSVWVTCGHCVRPVWDSDVCFFVLVQSRRTRACPDQILPPAIIVSGMLNDSETEIDPSSVLLLASTAGLDTAFRESCSVSCPDDSDFTSLKPN